MFMVDTIGNALFTKTQQQVLGLLYGNPEQSYYMNEIVRTLGMGKGTVKRELDKMQAAGLLTVSPLANQNHYQANPASPVFNELKSIIEKMSGVEGVIKASLQTVADKIEHAFLFGSIATGSATPESDIELFLVVNDLGYTEVTGLLKNVEQQLGRAVIPTLYEKKEFEERREKKQFFIRRVLEQPKIYLLGPHLSALADQCH